MFAKDGLKFDLSTSRYVGSRPNGNHLLFCTKKGRYFRLWNSHVNRVDGTTYVQWHTTDKVQAYRNVEDTLNPEELIAEFGDILSDA